MAGPIHGLVECVLPVGPALATGSNQFPFVCTYNFLNNNTGSLGIQRIAYSTGSKMSGQVTTSGGMNFFDQPNPAGENAWACFCFSSASKPFYVLIQWTGTTSFGTLPGNPGLVNNGSATEQFGIAICQPVTGGVNPWGGTTRNDGTDTKGSPVWNLTTGQAAFYPRSNDPVRAGATGATKQNMAAIVQAGSAVAMRMHCLADYDNLFIAVDSSNDNSYDGYIAFGAYTPLSGLSVDIPYFMMAGTSLPWSFGTQVGPVAGTTVGGGCSFPSIATSGSVAFSLDAFGTNVFQNAAAQPNNCFPGQRFDEWQALVYLNETPIIGAIGYIPLGQFYSMVYNVNVHDTNQNYNRVALGTSTKAAVKVCVPWISGTVPGGTAIRSNGIAF